VICCISAARGWPCIRLDSSKPADFDTNPRAGKQAGVLRVADLSVRFQTAEGSFLPVDRISFDLERGETFGLIGESGSGKTTVALRPRALIDMALACGPAVLGADEPTSSLDPVVQAEIVGLLRALCDERGVALLLATHDLALAARLCERIAVLYAGRIVERGP